MSMLFTNVDDLRLGGPSDIQASCPRRLCALRVTNCTTSRRVLSQERLVLCPFCCTVLGVWYKPNLLGGYAAQRSKDKSIRFRTWDGVEIKAGLE